MTKYLFGVFCTLLAIPCVILVSQPAWYKTVSEMKHVMEQDRKLLITVGEYIQTERTRLSRIKAEIITMQKTSKTLSREVQNRFWLPDFSLSLLDRYAMRWPRFMQDVSFNMTNPKYASINDARKDFPAAGDIAVVRLELLKLQDMYDLKTPDLANGYIFGQFSGKNLSSTECLYIGNEAIKNKNPEIYKEWINEAVNRAETIEARELINTYVERIERKKYFKEICSGNKNETVGDTNSKNLKCFMWDNFREPWLLLQPFKMEELAKSPDIVRFYDVISDKEIKIIKSISEPILGRGMTSDPLESLKQVNPDAVRVSHNCWLDENDKIVKKLSHRIGKLSGLDMSTAEQLQVATYGIAGHYDFHVDWAEYPEDIEYTYQNRKATFMFYLSDVEHGGATVFLTPRIAVKPVKGSAVLWHNLLPSGMGDKRTTHGACPVLVGKKWVANKWIRETDTEMCKQSEYIGRIH